MSKGIDFQRGLWYTINVETKERKNTMKKTGVTKRTYDKNVRRFAKVRADAWDVLNSFVESRCRTSKARNDFRDRLCEIVDKYIDFNCEMLTWCHRNGVDARDFVCDVVNLGITDIED